MGCSKLKIFVLLLIFASVSAIDFSKLYQGCEKKIVMRKVSIAQQCIMKEIQNDFGDLNKQGGGKDMSDPLKLLQDENIRNLFIPAMAKSVCQKNVTILNCIKPIIELKCLDVLPSVAVQFAYNNIIVPTFNYLCSEIVEKEALGDVLTCGLKLMKNINVRKCMPQMPKNNANLNAVCRAMEHPYTCLKNVMNKECPESADKVYGLIDILKNLVGCSYPMALIKKEPMIVEKVVEPHVNINHYHKSSGMSLSSGLLINSFTLFLVALFFHRF